MNHASRPLSPSRSHFCHALLLIEMSFERQLCRGCEDGDGLLLLDAHVRLRRRRPACIEVSDERSSMLNDALHECAYISLHDEMDAGWEM